METIKFERIGETIFALIENGDIIELKVKETRYAGSIEIGQKYCARVGKIDMRLSAAFVDLGEYSALLPFNGARPNYLIEGNAINVAVTKMNRFEKSAIVKYIGEAKGKQKCPSLIQDVNPWGDWPKPRDTSYNEKQRILEKIEELSQINVTLKNGGSIHFEQTKALCAIDIDAGGRTTGGNNQRNFNHKLNLEAAKEIGRQIRLRNISGLIVIDFVGAPSKLEAPFIMEALKSSLGESRKCEILPISKFGLCEIARERIGQSAFEIFGTDGMIVERRAINAINDLANALRAGKGKTITFKIGLLELASLSAWDFDWEKYLKTEVGGKYEMKTIDIGYEVY